MRRDDLKETFLTRLSICLSVSLPYPHFCPKLLISAWSFSPFSLTTTEKWLVSSISICHWSLIDTNISYARDEHPVRWILLAPCSLLPHQTSDNKAIFLLIHLRNAQFFPLFPSLCELNTKSIFIFFDTQQSHWRFAFWHHGQCLLIDPVDKGIAILVKTIPSIKLSHSN